MSDAERGASIRPRSRLPVPASYPRQVDATTCAIAALAVVAARAQADPGYLTASRERVERTQLELHAIAARIAVPWPQALGTSPWSLARLAQAATGLRYGIVVAGAAMRRRIDRALASGFDVFVYTGGSGVPLSGLIPRHVVVLLAHEGAPERFYAVFEPSSGRVYQVDLDDFYSHVESVLPALGHWRRVLFALVPRIDDDPG